MQSSLALQGYSMWTTKHCPSRWRNNWNAKRKRERLFLRHQLYVVSSKGPKSSLNQKFYCFSVCICHRSLANIVDWKPCYKDCCDDHEDFCTELYKNTRSEEDFKCKTTKEPITTTINTEATRTATTVTGNTSTTTTTTTDKMVVASPASSWLFRRNWDLKRL